VNRALIFLVCLLSLLFSCQSNPFDIELDDKTIDFQFIRLDQEVFRSEISNPFEKQEYLLSTYPFFYQEYFEGILRVGPVNDSSAIEMFDMVSGEIIFSDTQNQIDSIFFLDQKMRTSFHDAFRYYSHYFPSQKIPRVITMNSGYNYGIYPLKETLGIGLEFYLGKEHRIIKGLPIANFPNYQKEKMNPDYILSDALRGYLLTKNQKSIQGDKLIHHLIYQGKAMYILNALLPFEEEYLQMGYLSEQLDWAKRNEFNIWKAIIEENLVYSSDFKQIERFTGFGPFTQGFPKESPGMISLFLGKQIVKDYMNKYPETKLSELFALNDMQILNTYKPER